MHIRNRTPGALIFGLLTVSLLLAAQDAKRGSISGTVVMPDGKPAANISISYLKATELRTIAERRYNSPTPGSGFADGVQRMTPAQKEAAIANAARVDERMTYVMGSNLGGTLAGTTDANGAFTIRNLPAETYIVMAGERPDVRARLIASRQPIVVAEGQQVQLATPIQLKAAPGPGGN